jgi:hypothetical protein
LLFLKEGTRDLTEGELLLLRLFVFTFDLDDTVLDEVERLESDLRILEGKDLICLEEETVLEREEERVFLEGYDFIEDLEL